MSMREQAQDQVLEYGTRMRKERDAAIERAEKSEQNVHQAFLILKEGLQTDGAHHKQWHMEEALRSLGYGEVVEASRDVVWDKGIPA